MNRRVRQMPGVGLGLCLLLTPAAVLAAADEAVEWDDLGQEAPRPSGPEKTWTIVFSQVVEGDSVTPDTIWVTDEQEQPLQVTRATNGTAVTVSPVNPYEVGRQYTLWIRDIISAEEGKALARPVKWTFVIVEGTDENNLEVASMLNEFQFHNGVVNQYYAEGLQQMGSVELENQQQTGMLQLLQDDGTLSLEAALLDTVPSEFMGVLPTDGFIPAPPGACPAAADPRVSFWTATERITGDLLENIYAIPADSVMAGASDPGSLAQAMQDAMAGLMDPQVMGELMTPEGWNTHLWDQLKALRQPARSLMDYHLWNVAGDIEGQAAQELRQELEGVPLPEPQKSSLLTAFDNSQKTGWFANRPATAGDALARMDIVAEMTGSISGTVYEQRAFTISGAGEAPVFGVQTGEGIVTFQHPELGALAFEITIELDEFDQLGRAIAGQVVAVNHSHGYTCVFDMKADGTKEGTLKRNGEPIGQLVMTVDAEQFENYVDLVSGEETPLPPASLPPAE